MESNFDDIYQYDKYVIANIYLALFDYLVFRQKYLTAHFHGLKYGGVGNKLFEMISIFGIAKALKRTPFIVYNITDDLKLEGFYHLSQASFFG
jgi:hypothetical protein